MRNRLYSATMTAGGQTTTLVTNYYDATALTDRPGLSLHDSAYGTATGSRGNVTQIVTPGNVRNVAYDIGGVATGSDDGQGHSIAITLAAGTNSSLPGLIQPNGQTTLQQSMTYTAAFQPATLTDQNGNPSTNHYDANGRVDFRITPTGNQINYTYDYNQHTVTALNTVSG
jgi:hypothetical protein